MSNCHLDSITSMTEHPGDPFDEIACEDVGRPCVYCDELAARERAFCSAECEQRAYAEMDQDRKPRGPKAAERNSKVQKNVA
jgi:hypothetical protein